MAVRSLNPPQCCEFRKTHRQPNSCPQLRARLCPTPLPHGRPSSSGQFSPKSGQSLRGLVSVHDFSASRVLRCLSPRPLVILVFLTWNAHCVIVRRDKLHRSKPMPTARIPKIASAPCVLLRLRFI